MEDSNVARCEYVSCTAVGDHRIIVSRYNTELNVHCCEAHAKMLRDGHPIALYFYTYVNPST